MGTQMLKPGLLVSLRTSIDGGVKYSRKDLDVEDLDVGANVAVEAPDATVERWETVKITEDPAEFAAATKIRAKARGLITSVCAPSQFGLLCPLAAEDKLDAVVAEAHEMIDAFRKTAKTLDIGLYVLKGRIAETDSEATRAIAREMRDLLDEMASGINACDVEVVRKAASKARYIGAMLDESAGKKVTEAISAARAAAREIVKRVKIGSELAETVLAELDIEAVASARFAFLDLEERAAVEGEALAAVLPRGLDLDPDDDLGDVDASAAVAADGRQSQEVSTAGAQPSGRAEL